MLLQKLETEVSFIDELEAMQWPTVEGAGEYTYTEELVLRQKQLLELHRKICAKGVNAKVVTKLVLQPIQEALGYDN